MMAVSATLHIRDVRPSEFVAAALYDPVERRPRRTARNAAAAATAVTFHLALLVLVSLSWSKTTIPLSFAGDRGSVLASLTPASALEATPAVSPPQASALNKLNDSLTEAFRPASKTPPQQFSDHLLDQMDVTKPTSQPAQAPSTRTSPALAATPSLLLQDEGNPWTRVSSISTDPSFVQKLWAAIKPCWKGGYTQSTSSIRVVLDASGRVKAMSSLSGVSALEKAQAEQVASAVVACAPYRIGTAGAFLVRAPV